MVLTNAKVELLRAVNKQGTAQLDSCCMQGAYSSSLAEAAIMGCLHFAKDIKRLQRAQADSHWEKFIVNELR